MIIVSIRKRKSKESPRIGIKLEEALVRYDQEEKQKSKDLEAFS